MTAEEMFLKGYNCSQTVFAMFSEKYGISQSEAFRIGCGFGGGMRNASVCGAVTGAIMVIGSKYGYTDEKDLEGKTKCYDETLEFTKEFKKRNSSIICRDLLNCDISTKEGMEIGTKNNLFKTTCLKMVLEAVKILKEMGY